MGLTTALFTGLSGMVTHSEAINVSGNNISNTNTTGFKSSRFNYQASIYSTQANATSPTAELGGRNPSQIGYGVGMGSIDRNFNFGSIQPTGVKTDMAIDGNGFFVLNVAGNQLYSRVGNFGLDRDFKLVNPSNGGIVQGYGIDDNFNVIPGVIGDINIPLGTLTVAEATQSVDFNGRLNAGGDVATLGSINMTNALLDGGAPATAASNLVDLENTGGVSLFNLGDVVTITGATKGGAVIPDKTFEVGGNTTGADAFGNTMQQFMDFLANIFGINTAAEPGSGITLSPAGELVITGNSGTVNDLAIASGNIVVNQFTTPTIPFEMSKPQDANGESVRTTFVVYDSLGTPMTVDLSVVLTGKTNGGTDWRFFVNSEDDTDLDTVLGTGTLSFDTKGTMIGATNAQFIIDRAGTGAATPQTIDLRFGFPDNSLKALTNTNPAITARSQDGSPIGTLEDFVVDGNGTIMGIFSNSLTRPLGQLVVAMFSNNQGLVDMGNGFYNVSVNSGNAALVVPGTGGAGRIVGQALELSNVELSQEFISLITASTGFSASSRVLTTSDQMIKELLAIVR